MRPDGPIQSDSPAALAADGPLLRVPDGFDIFTAQFSRAGDDLVIAAEASPPLTVVGYFAADSPAALVAPNGAMLTGDVVELLAGPRAPGHYAQADAPEGAVPIGQVEVLTGTATATRVSGETVELAQSDPVFQGDVIETGGGSKLGIRLEDGTLASMSEQSRLVLNEFVYDADSSDNWMLVDLIEGSFAFLTGAIAPSGGMEIKTPVAVMAIRGTMPIAIVAENGASQFFAGSDKNYELLHLTTKQLLAVITSATGYFLGSPDAALETIDIAPETLDEINELIDVLNDAAASLGLLGIMAGSGFHSYGSFGSIEGNLGALLQFLTLLDGSLTEEAVLEVEDGNQFLMAEAELIAVPDQAVTVEELPVEIDVLANDSHPDGGELTVVFAGVPNGQGTVTITADQQLLYDPGTAFIHLALGETANVVITYAVSHPSGAITSSTVTVTVTGLNQAPVIVQVAEINVDEQTDTEPLETTITVAFSDIDLNNVGHTAEVTGVVATGETSGLTLDDAALMALLTPGLVTKLAGEAGGSASFEFSVASGVLDYLAVGEVLTLTYTVEIDDQDGGVTSHSFDIVITGTNDDPVIVVGSTDDSGAVTELADGHQDENSIDHVAQGTIAFGDVDLSDTHTAGVVAGGPGYLGTFALGTIDQASKTIGWTFTLADAAIDYLAKDETLVQTYTVTIDDGNGGTVEQVVTMTITGTNDAPTIVAEETDASGSVTELADTTGSSFEHVVAGSIAFADVDLSDDHSASFTEGDSGYFGTFELGGVDAAGNTVGWTFSVIDSEIDHLPKDTTLTQTYIVTIDDGQGGTVQQVVTITINGSNDAPVIVIGDGDSDWADLDETDSGLQEEGTLTVSDVSVTDVVTASVTEVVASGDHASQIDDTTLLGFLTVTSPVLGSPGADGTLTWTFNSGSEAFDFLADGEELVLTYTVTVDDGTDTTSHSVTIAIAGTNDDPVITVGDGDSIGDDLDETDAGLQAQGTLSVVDLDISDEVTADVTQVTATGDHGTQISNATLLSFLTVTGTVIGDGATAGTLDWVFNSLTEAFDFLAEHEELVLTYTVTVADGNGGTHSQQVTVTITGTNDAPTILAAATDASGAVTELAGTTGSQTDLVDGGTIAFADLDLSDTHAASFVANANGYLGSFALGTVNQGANSVGWSFTVADGALDHLAAGQELTQSYTVTIDDGNGGTVEQVVNVTITGTNDAPVTDDVSGLSGFAGTAIEVTLSGSDVDGTVSYFKITTLPTGGGLFLDAQGLVPVDPNNIPASGNEATIYFIPDGGVTGEVNFQYAAVDNSGAQDLTPASVDITVETTKIYITISQDTWQGGADLPMFQNFTVTIAGVTYDLGDMTVVDSNFYTQDGDGFALGIGTGSGNKERFVTFEIDGVPAGATAEISFDYMVTDQQGEAFRDGIQFYAGDSPDDMVLVFDGDDHEAFTGNENNAKFSSRVLSFDYALIAGVLVISDQELTATVDPIILDLGEPGFDLSGTASFDLDADGQAETLAWTGGEDAILVMDLDGSGTIDSGNEVFSPFFNGGGFADALAALASLDGNGDGVIDGKDEAFADLLAWVDANGDGESQPDELISLADLGIVSFDLNAGSVAYQIDGQSIVAEGQFTKADGTTGNYVAVELDRIFDASEPLIAGNEGSDIDAPDQEVASKGLSIHDVVVDYRDGKDADMWQFGFAMATGQHDSKPGDVDRGFDFSAPPRDILSKLTEQHDAANVEIA